MKRGSLLSIAWIMLLASALNCGTQTAGGQKTFTPVEISPTSTNKGIPTVNRPTEQSVSSPVGGFTGRFVSITSSDKQKTVSLFHADGTKIKDILVLPADPKNPWKVYGWRDVEKEIKPSPDRKELLYATCAEPSEEANKPSFELFTLATDGANVTRIPVKVNQMWDWLPDGTIFANVGDMNGNLQGKNYVIFDRDGSNLRSLDIHVFYHYGFPILSPDGKKAIFSTNENETYVADLDSGASIKLSNGWSPWGAAWSPDGKQVVFRDDTGTGIKLFIINVDGTSKRQLTDRADYDDNSPLNSPDGKTILFESSNRILSDRDMPISVVPADGSSPALVIGSGLNPRWSPDGSLVYFSGWPLETAQTDDSMANYYVKPDGSQVTRTPDNWFGTVQGEWLPGE